MFEAPWQGHVVGIEDHDVLAAGVTQSEIPRVAGTALVGLTHDEHPRIGDALEHVLGADRSRHRRRRSARNRLRVCVRTLLIARMTYRSPFRTHITTVAIGSRCAVVNRCPRAASSAGWRLSSYTSSPSPAFEGSQCRPTRNFRKTKRAPRPAEGENHLQLKQQTDPAVPGRELESLPPERSRRAGGRRKGCTQPRTRHGLPLLRRAGLTRRTDTPGSCRFRGERRSSRGKA